VDGLLQFILVAMATRSDRSRIDLYNFFEFHPP
jgi:hypothetical protein